MYRILVGIFLLCASTSWGQVYQYTPMGMGDFETNPTALFVSSYRNLLTIESVFAPQNEGYHQTVGWSSSVNDMYGFGIKLSTTAMSEHNYKHGALAFGQRFVLFNKLKVGIGATYKFAQTESNNRLFDFQSDESLPDLNTSFCQQANLGIGLYLTHKTALTVNWINIPLTKTMFPRYLNIALSRVKLSDHRRLYFGYLFTRKSLHTVDHDHQLYLDKNIANLNRHHSLIGGVLGEHTAEHYSVRPYLTFFGLTSLLRARRGSRRFISNYRLTLGYQHYFSRTDQPLSSTIQLILKCNL